MQSGEDGFLEPDTEIYGYDIIPPVARRPAHYTVSWSDYADTAETGDIVLFSGQSMLSKSLKIAQGFTNWSHIGMIVRLGEDKILIFESTSADGVIDVISGVTKEGPRLVDAKTTIQRYIRAAPGCMVVLRRLYVDQRFKNARGFSPASRMAKFTAFLMRVHKLPYERNPIELMRAAPMGRGLELVYAAHGTSSYFCSELVYESLLVLGLVDNDNPSLYLPADFDDTSQRIPFPVLRDRHGKPVRPIQPLVALGPNMKVVFSGDSDAIPVISHPGGLRQPTRKHMRLATL